MSQESQFIAEIPQDITGSPGKILVSDVYGVAGAQKRKRSELALAVDRQGINIYNVRQSRLVSSYAVSPQATFTCPPQSLRYRASDGTSAYRVTFCSLKWPQPRLYRFYETLSPGSSLDKQIATSFVDLQEKNSPVVRLEIIPREDRDITSTDSLLAIHQDGQISCYTENLEKQLWSSSACAGAGQQVLLANLTDATQLEGGLLRHREDILASLGRIEANQHKDLLVLLSCSTIPEMTEQGATKLSLQILDVSKPSVPGDSSRFEPRKIFSVGVPCTDHYQLEDADFKINLASGNLYQRTLDCVIVFDMTDLLPKIVHEVVVGKGDVSSFLRLSSHNLALSRHSTLSLVSLPYCSIQGESSVASVPSSENGALRLVSYFESLKMIAAIKGRSLIAMQLPKPPSGPVVSRKRKREGTLADAIGRGSYARQSLPFTHATADMSIDNLGTLSTLIRDDAWESQVAKWADLGGGQLSDAFIKEFNVHHPKDEVPIDQRKVSYVLSRIITVERSRSVEDGKSDKIMHLKFIMSVRKAILRWLIHRGYLTKDIIEDTLRQNNTLHGSASLASASIIDLLSKEDRSLQNLAFLLSSSTPLGPPELASALSTVIQSHNTPVNTKPTKPNDQPCNPKSESYHVPPQTYNKLLHLLLTRFSPLPSQTVTAALRTTIPQPTLLSLIDALRLQIATAGWFTPYDNAPPPSKKEATPNNHLAQTTHLLNSTLDALGAGGWILGSSSSTIHPPPTTTTHPAESTAPSASTNADANPTTTEDPEAQAANTLTHMSAEIAAALEGIHEAVYLTGMLSQVLLCGKDSLPRRIPKKVKKAQEVVARVEGRELPLGLKMVKVISKRRVAGGGELRVRSWRDLERERSRQVGVYGFEKLR